jgi:1,4-alpha-glucan branching enzyme
MGATPYGEGVTFRVWAPFARGVSVAGTMNGWSLTRHPLSAEGNGTWSADVAGAKPGDEYKLVVVSASGDALWRRDPYARTVTAAGNGIVASDDFAWREGDFQMPSWNTLVLYELHVGTFSFDPATGRGNFDTVIARLDGIRDLGCNAIQLMPSDEFAGSVSWGYNPSDLFAIEESYGGLDALRHLVDAAHARGIAVFFDVVYNHFGPDDLDLWRFDGWSQDGGGGIYFYNDWRRATPWGDTRADYGRGEVRQFIRDNVLHWLEACRLDGLRWDATGFIRNAHGRDNSPADDLPDGWSLMQWCTSEVRSRQPWKLLIAEDMHDNGWLTRSAGAGGAGFGAQWSGGFVHAVHAAATAARDEDRSMAALAAVIEQRLGDDACARVLFTESHDEVAAGNGGARLPERIAPGNADGYAAQKRSTLAAALVFTAPGIPMMFMGQEHLEWGAWSDDRELDWSKAARFAGITALYRDLAHLRRNWADATRGLSGPNVHVHHVNDADKVLAFHRWDRGGPRDDVVVVLSFSHRAFPAYRIGLPRGGRWRVRFNGDWRGYSALFGDCPSLDLEAVPGANGDGMPFGGDVGVGAYTAIVLSQDA